MKTISNLLLLIGVFTLIQSCKKDDPAPDFRNPATAECLLKKIIEGNDTTSIFYDQELKVIKIAWSSSGYMEISYDNTGQVSKIDEFYPNNENYYTLFTWSDNQIEAVFYEFVNEQWVTSSKQVSELNGNREVTKITDYSKTGNGDWVENGDYYLFEWSNGNMLKAENWDNYSSPANKNAKEENVFPIIYSAKQAYQTKRRIKAEKKDYNLYSTTTFEYDGRINPSRYLTAGNLFPADELNSSKNNWSKSTYTDINNREIIRLYEYIYNDKELPLSLNIEETNKYPNGTFVKNYAESYEYECF